MLNGWTRQARKIKITYFSLWVLSRTFLSGSRKKNSMTQVLNSHTRATNLVSQFFGLCRNFVEGRAILHQVFQVKVIVLLFHAIQVTGVKRWDAGGVIEGGREGEKEEVKEEQGGRGRGGGEPPTG